MTLRRLAPSELTVTFDPAELGFEDTSQIKGAPCGWIGQQRAEKAARFGLALDRPDYHLFVLGESGSGRSSLMFRLMTEMAAARPAAPDLVYLHNFDSPERPLVLRLHAGQAVALRASLDAFSARIARDLPCRLAEESVRLDAERVEKEHLSEEALEQALAALQRRAAAPLLERELDALRQAMAGQVLNEDKFAHYLAGLADDVLRSLNAFAAAHDGAREPLGTCLARYRVNVLVDNAQVTGAPALRDDDPVFRSLFGGIDFQMESGTLATDFTRIRAGNLHRAHGGYLMLHLRDVLRDAAVREKLQRYLRSGCLQIEEPTAAAGPLSTTTLEPEALEISAKLVLIGGREEYYDLQESDPELMRHFRVKVDFAEYFPANTATRRALAGFIAQRCRALGLPHFSSPAVARLLLEMQRAIDDQRHIGTELGQLEGWLIEAAACCRQRSEATVSEQDVAEAFAARRERHDYPEQQMLESIAAGELMIQAHGVVVGQINGLAQVDLGDYCFGLPVRMTARTYAGDEGVLNIDREVEMTCPSHDKGVFILQGWLSAAFARLAPLCLSASLVFEQEYHGVEGDSASCAELFALLSSLSGIALPQGMGVTGALNQHGEVMPVGGINEKIEGWFRTCSALGLDGTQGVIIPARNRPHLMLDREVIEAVERGEFRIHVIDHVLEGLTLLTGMEAGAMDESGHYPEDSAMGRVQQTLEEYRRAFDESGHAREHEHGK